MKIVSIAWCIYILLPAITYPQHLPDGHPDEYLITCTNKIFVDYKDYSGATRSGCYNSVAEAKNPPYRTTFDYYMAANNQSYFPVKIHIPDRELTKIAAISNSKCNTFSTEDARNCLNNSVAQWNALCNSSDRSIIVVDDENEAHTIIRFSELESDFSPNPGNTAANVKMYLRVTPSNPPHTAIAYRKNNMSHVPEMFFNITRTFLKESGVWSTDCPCDITCNENKLYCIPFCRILAHELTHMYGVYHNDANNLCWADDPYYDKFSLCYPGDPENMEFCNSWNTNINEVCDLSVRNIDKCVFCKRVCPDKCGNIPTNIVVDPVEEAKSFAVEIYPNPVKNIVVMQIDNGGDEAIEVAIYDILGNNIVRYEPIYERSSLIRIDLSYYFMRTGVYLVTASSRDEMTVKRVVVE